MTQWFASEAERRRHPGLQVSCLLHISDPHFGTAQPTVVDALERLTHALAPDAVILSGDPTQRATRQEFAARRFADRLGAP